jgi:dolichyl-diphosphooligosaccharide--protein glycosyltransferase
MNLRERLAKIDWKTVAIVLFLVLLAFGIRAYLLRYDLMFEFDTYWHARMTSYIVQSGSVPGIDPLAYYQLGSKAIVPLQTQLFWYVSAFFYFVVSFFTTGGFSYSKELLIAVVKFLPAFYGALVVLGMYFLGKEAYGKKAGYLMAFFGAVSASFIYRSMAGFFEAGTLGYVFIVFGLYFVLRAVKRMNNTKEMVINGLAAGIILGIVSAIYALYIIIPLLLAFYLVFTALAYLGRHQTKELVRFVQTITLIFAVFFGTTLLVTPNKDWIAGMLSDVSSGLGAKGAFLPALGIIGLVVIGGIVFFSLRKNRPSEKADQNNHIRWLKLLLLLAVFVVVLIAMFLPKDHTGITAISVGEESPGHLYFFHKFSFLLAFPFLALVLIPIIDFRKKNVDLASMLLYPFILISLYLAWDRLHYSYNLGVPLAIAAAYIVYYGLRFFESRPKSERALAGIAIAFVVLIGTTSATLFTQNNTPTIELNTGWKEGLQWLKNNTPPDAKLFNWWDEGHWITFLAERKVITDNRNFDQVANSDVGKFVLTDDFNEAVSILKKYDSDYITLGADLFSKRNSMVLYAYYINDPSQFQGNDPRLDSVQSFDIPCGKQESNGSVSYQCGGNTLSESQINGIPTTWTDIPSAIPDGRNPIFYYRSTDNAVIYQLSLKENQTVFAKIWFKAPDVAPYFEEVFPSDLPGYSNKELKIFKIHKEKLSQVPTN